MTSRLAGGCIRLVRLQPLIMVDGAGCQLFCRANLQHVVGLVAWPPRSLGSTRRLRTWGPLSPLHDDNERKKGVPSRAPTETMPAATQRHLSDAAVRADDADAAVSLRNRAPLGLTEHLNVYKELSKAKLSGLVVLTTMFGYAMAPVDLSASMLFWTTVGTAFCVTSANTLNQWAEVPYDSQMKRTTNRPIVRGAISPLHALGFGVGTGVVGAGILCTMTNPWLAWMGTGNTVLYAGAYTWLKRVSISNTWVGSVVGAVPPLMGWVAGTGGIEAGGLILAGILFAWQFPHFNALSWNLRGDYSRAGYQMMSVTDPALCRRVALQYSLALIPLSIGASYVGMCDWWLAVDSTILNGWLSYRAWEFYRDGDDKSARKLFLFSIIHLPALIVLFLFHKRRGLEKETGAPEEVIGPVGTMLPASP